MKRTWTCLALGALLGSAPVGWGDAPLFFCMCSEGEFGVPGHYLYPVDAVSYPMVEFTVGTNDLDVANYTNVLTPPGWSFTAEPVGMHHAHGVLTLHGSISPGPCYCLTQGRVRWWTDDPQYAVEIFTFGFNHPWRAEDVGYALVTRREGPPPEYYTFCEFWDSPVGWGQGPLHGPSAAPESCWDNGECVEGDYCAKEVGDCDGQGHCWPRPQICPTLLDPVCGCDGDTYPNDCVAAMAGVNVDHWGACEGWPCWNNEECGGETVYCAKAVGDCDGQGTCQFRPTVCAAVWDPVCGCDGVTYSNACFAAMAGMSVDYPAPCQVDGDLDCDGDVDFDDIDPFVLALAGADVYLAQYPYCNWLNGDCDHDEDVDFDDINPFVDMLGF